MSFNSQRSCVSLQKTRSNPDADAGDGDPDEGGGQFTIVDMNKYSLFSLRD